MSLNVVAWQDKQLDDLRDLLRTADYSAVAAFISQNFLCTGSRILTDPSNTTLRATVNGTDSKVIDLSAGIFQLNGLISQLDSVQTCNILNTTNGTWGTGQATHATLNRWSIIAVKNNEQFHTPEQRWFVDDSSDPNAYATQLTNTLINKAYYDIVVVHGVNGGGVPDAPAGYWTIAEIFVPAGATSILGANIYDTTNTSQKIPANWSSTTRVLRLEFWSTLFGVDHDPTTGFHKDGGWHIGSSLVTSNANELNRLDGVGTTVTAPNLTRLTDGSTLGDTELHRHSQTMLAANPGYVKLSGGIIIQWGHGVAPPGLPPRHVDVLFSIVFPNAVLGIALSGLTTGPASLSHFNLNVSGCTLYTAGAGGEDIYYIVIGY